MGIHAFSNVLLHLGEQAENQIVDCRFASIQFLTGEGGSWCRTRLIQLMQSLTTVTKRTRPASKSMAEIELALRRVMISFPTAVGSHVITLAPPASGPIVTFHACHLGSHLSQDAARQQKNGPIVTFHACHLSSHLSEYSKCIFKVHLADIG